MGALLSVNNGTGDYTGAVSGEYIAISIVWRHQVICSPYNMTTSVFVHTPSGFVTQHPSLKLSDFPFLHMVGVSRVPFANLPVIIECDSKNLTGTFVRLKIPIYGNFRSHKNTC